MAALSASSMAGLSAAQLDMMAEHKAWQDEDGSYHEELVHDEDEAITNPGGTS